MILQAAAAIVTKIVPEQHQGYASIAIVVAVILVNIAIFIAAFGGFRKEGGIKRWLQDFPTQNASVAVALLLIAETGLVVLLRLALGMVFPENYDTWILSLLGLAGVNAAGLGIKRVTDDAYVKAKGVAEAAKLAATTQSQVPINNAENVNLSVAPKADVAPAATLAASRMENTFTGEHAIAKKVSVAPSDDPSKVPGMGD